MAKTEKITSDLDAAQKRIAELEAKLAAQSAPIPEETVTIAQPVASAGTVIVYKVYQDVFPATASENVIRAPFTVRSDTFKTSTGVVLNDGVLERMMTRNAEQGGGVLEKVMEIPAKDFNDALLAAAVV